MHLVEKHRNFAMYSSWPHAVPLEMRLTEDWQRACLNQDGAARLQRLRDMRDLAPSHPSLDFSHSATRMAQETAPSIGECNAQPTPALATYQSGSLPDSSIQDADLHAAASSRTPDQSSSPAGRNSFISMRGTVLALPKGSHPGTEGQADFNIHLLPASAVLTRGTFTMRGKP